jgi:hypothetical protein
MHNREEGQAEANVANSGPSEIEKRLGASRAAVVELENFLDVLTLRITAEAEPTTRACWRAHKAATGAEICRLRSLISELEMALSIEATECGVQPP